MSRRMYEVSRCDSDPSLNGSTVKHDKLVAVKVNPRIIEALDELPLHDILQVNDELDGSLIMRIRYVGLET